MSVPLTTSLAELMSVGAIPYVRTPPTSSFIPCYLSLVCTPPDTVLLDMSFFVAHPADRCLFLVRRGLALAFVGAILGARCGGVGTGRGQGEGASGVMLVNREGMVLSGSGGGSKLTGTG